MTTTRAGTGGAEGIGLQWCVAGESVNTADSAASRLQSQILELYDTLRVPVFRYLICRGVSEPEAHEILQETFLRTYEHLRARVKKDNNLRGWIFRVAHNIAVNRYKEQRRFAGSEAELREVIAPIADPSPNAEERLLRNERLRRISVALRALSPQERQCIHLRAEGFRYREIAAIMGIGVSTVADSLGRALTKLIGDEDT